MLDITKFIIGAIAVGVSVSLVSGIITLSLFEKWEDRR